jgi:hypothetical protein
MNVICKDPISLLLRINRCQTVSEDLFSSPDLPPSNAHFLHRVHVGQHARPIFVRAQLRLQHSLCTRTLPNAIGSSGDNFQKKVRLMFMPDLQFWQQIFNTLLQKTDIQMIFCPFLSVCKNI